MDIVTTVENWAQNISWPTLALRSIAVLLKVGIIIGATAIVIKISRSLTAYAVKRIAPLAEKTTQRGRQRVETLSHAFRHISLIIILMVAAILTLKAVGIEPMAVIATLGVASLAVGFGAQSLIKDLIGGVFILCEDQFGVGDVISINGESGLVELMTLRITQLRNTEGMLITIPNGAIQTVKNQTSEWSRVDFRVAISFEADADAAMQMISQEIMKIREEKAGYIIDEPEILGVDEIKDSCAVIRVWIRTAPQKQWEVKRELNKRVLKRFSVENIKIPFPQQTVWVKNDNE